MLQQILRDMWVDPELLAELDDSQKQTLFCRMREEQVRRWAAWDKEQPNQPNQHNQHNQHNQISQPTHAQRPGKKHVDFLLGADGEPWVWVMGEHPDDPSIEEILEKEAREKARKQAEMEAEHLRKSMEAELSELLDLNQKQLQAMDAVQHKDDDMAIYCSVDELREKINQTTETNNLMNNNPGKRDILQEISYNTPKKVSQRVAMWEKRVMEERTSEIFRRIQRKQREAVKEAEEQEQRQELVWREQERKAKEAELQIREIARRAREEHRRTSVLDMDVENGASSPPPNGMKESPLNSSMTVIPGKTAKPPSKEAVVEWFRSSEIARRAGLLSNSNEVAPWFHGLITRQEAECLLMEKSVGSFLVRVSERIWGYAISYRDTDRCKHYLVDASNGHYQFLGANQLSHNTLGDMVEYHGKQPITQLGAEYLLHPCPWREYPSILQGLLNTHIQR